VQDKKALPRYFVPQLTKVQIRYKFLHNKAKKHKTTQSPKQQKNLIFRALSGFYTRFIFGYFEWLFSYTKLGENIIEEVFARYFPNDTA
jgi:hypothetical protein